MVLSEHERRLLQEMESHLLAEDPALVSSMRSRRSLPAVAKLALAGAGLVFGILLMAVGVWRAHALGIAVALLGYLILLASTCVTVDWIRARGDHGPLAQRAARRARRAS
jgi:high-affinity Fe2+/Pb2+ permease